MVRRIREVLRFKSEAVTVFVGLAALPFDASIEEVAAVELHTRLRGKHIHDTS